MKLLGISGTIIGSKTSVLVNKVIEEVRLSYPEVETEILDLRNYDLQICDGRDISTYNNDTRKAIKLIDESEVLLIGSPIFQGSMSGALKNLIDLAPVSSFRGKVMGFVATGNSSEHYLVIENQLKPIAGYFRAFVAPSSIYAHRGHFEAENEIKDEELLQQIKKLGEELVLMQKVIENNKKQPN